MTPSWEIIDHDCEPPVRAVRCVDSSARRCVEHGDSSRCVQKCLLWPGPVRSEGRGSLRRAWFCLTAIPALLASFLLVSTPAGATIRPHGLPVSSAFERPGPFATTSTTITAGDSTYDVFRPSHYVALGFKSPIVTWGNGTNATPGMYTTLLRHFASYGFTVIATTLVNTGSGREIAAAARYLIKAEATSGNEFTGHLDTHEVAAVGHSQGATGAVRVATMDPKMIASVMTFSLPNSKWSAPNPDCSVKADCEAHPGLVTQPVFFVSTHGPLDAIIASPATERADFESVRGRAALGIIAVSGGRPADHNSVQDADVGGNPHTELGYATAWLEFTLRADTKSATAFSGHHPELPSNSDWPHSMEK
jgi:pimeloyl-ACP methyl ester carboxylesterase